MNVPGYTAEASIYKSRQHYTFMRSDAFIMRPNHSQGGRKQGPEAEMITTATNGQHLITPQSQTVIRHDCNWIDCRYTISRELTRDMARYGGSAVVACGVLAAANPALVVACGFEAYIFQQKAQECREKNQCFSCRSGACFFTMACRGDQNCVD